MSYARDNSQGIFDQVQSLNGGPLAGFRNRIINGDMRVAQRGTTYALTTNAAYGSIDRWIAFQNTSANGVFAQVAGSNGFQYFAKLGRNSGATTTGALSMATALESLNSIPLQGQTVTLSFYAKAGANFSATSNILSIFLTSGTGTDQSAAGLMAGSWPSDLDPINTTQSLTTTLTKYSFTANLGSGVSQVGVALQYTPTGTAGADDNVYITGVQLEVGSIATPYEQIPYGVQLGMCQRYYWQKESNGIINACTGLTTGFMTTYPLPVYMRVDPTITTNITNANFTSGGAPSGTQWGLQVAGISAASITGTITIGTQSTANSIIIYGYGATISEATNSLQPSTGTTLTASAEL